MHLTKTLLAITAIFLASSDNLTAATKATPATQDGLYAEIYNVEDGVVTKKMRVPLGDVEEYTESDFEQLKNTLSAEERAAVFLPTGFDTFYTGLGKFLGFFKRSKRRLHIEA
eukprot:jgi/Phyca11/126240/e_gw1.62.246.1